LKSKIIVVFLLLIVAAAVVAPLHAQEQPKLVIDVVRTMKSGQYGIVHVTDEFKLLNNGTTPVSYLDVGFARHFRDNVYYVDAKDNQGHMLTIDPDVNQTSSEFYMMRVHFAQDLTSGHTYLFTMTSILDNVITQVTGGFEFNFTAAPVLTQDVHLANVTFISATASNFKYPVNTTYTVTDVGGIPAAVHYYEPWKAYSSEEFFAPYATVNQYILDLPWAQRDIIIGNDGSLGVKDQYSFYNPSIAVTALSITLPDGAYNVMAYDVVGALWTTPQTPGIPAQVTVSPRYGSGIGTQESFNFTLTYNVPQSKYLKQLNWWGTYNLTLSFLNNQDDFIFENATVKIDAPSGFKITELKTAPQSPVSDPIQVGQSERTFNLRGVTDLNPLSFGVMFSYSPFWSAFPVLPWILALEVIIFAAAVVLEVRRGHEAEVPVPVERLREFVGLYDERLALSRELIIMEEDVGRGSLVKHEFRRRSKVMELRLDEINRSLMEVKSELRAISSRYDDLIRRIDRAEAEIDASWASMNQVKGQYRAAKFTRETYDSMVRDINKRIDRAQETVETILITLREEAR
jgi:hypothetical protein